MLNVLGLGTKNNRSCWKTNHFKVAVSPPYDGDMTSCHMTKTENEWTLNNIYRCIETKHYGYMRFNGTMLRLHYRCLVVLTWTLWLFFLSNSGPGILVFFVLFFFSFLTAIWLNSPSFNLWSSSPCCAPKIAPRGALAQTLNKTTAKLNTMDKV